VKRNCFFIGTPLGDLSIMKQFEALAHELAGRGHQVLILAPHRRVDLARPHGNPAVLIWPSERPTGWRDAWFLYKLIRQYKPDCLVASYAAVNIMMVVGWFTRVPKRIAWYHTLSSQINLDGKMPGWKMRLLRLRKKLVYSLSTQIVPVSQAASEDLRTVYREPEHKLRVFRNAVADPLAPTPTNGNSASRRLVVCIARLSPSKGQDVLIRAAALLQDRQVPFQLVFIGDGPARDSYTRLARDLGVADRCMFAGSLGHAEVLNRMRAATVSVLPSRSDNCPLVIIESLAVGTPVIASRVGGIPEVVRDGVDGFLVAPDDPQALASKLNSVLTNDNLARQLRANARAGFLERFEQARAVQEQVEWLERSLPTQRRASAMAK
jgi:glycosyltransferase involved in cell wall biosynthesis